MKILARHKNLEGCLISESFDERPGYRGFTATIRGFRGWKIYRGIVAQGTFKDVIEKVREIRDKIDSGNEEIFHQKGYFLDSK